MGEHQIKRPGHLGEIERLDQQARVADLSPPAAAHPAPELLLPRPPAPCWLFLERAKRSEVALGVGDLLHGLGAESADQLVLQVYDADIEAQRLHLGASEVEAEAGALEAAPKVPLLAGVAEARQPEV